jgi:Mg2+ and Co2+ transporter CorA
VDARIEPEPTEEEREAIAAALAPPPETRSGWAEAALREGVEEGAPEA